MIADIESLRGVTLETLYDTPEGRLIKSCIQCGTCAGSCPHGEYMEYPPRRIIKMMQLGLLDKVFDSDSMLKCVNCYACMSKCPREIHLTEVLLQLIKEQTIMRLPVVPQELQKALENSYRYGNPMGESGRKRINWMQNLDVPVRILSQNSQPVDVLWFVESYPSYHPRGQDTARAIAKIFNRLNVDFAILGNEEKSAGECGMLSWESGLAESLVDYNMAIFTKYKFNQLVTSDPHALDAFLYRYKMFGFKAKVTHVIPFLWQYFDKLKPMLINKLHYSVTYHDSCCLGRHNGYYEEPREILKAIPGIKITEMVHNRSNSICCGGGGGGMWLDTYFKSQNIERLSDNRIKEAIETGADVLAVACPYEMPRFEDALKVAGYDGKMVVKDITELILESMED
ncbi:MAG: iron-sulfur cluster-binding protein [Ignavibacteria bacterium]|nr:iron-sulfur cluster-binding protein [Ignavibacteria bacterium]